MAIDEFLKRVYPGTAEEFCGLAAKAMLTGEKLFVVTANPEILMHACREQDLRDLLLSESAAVVPDGISVVKAMRLCGLPAQERVTGVDLAERLLQKAGEAQKSVFLLGAREEVVSALAGKLKARYPGMTVEYCNGYVEDKDAAFERIRQAEPDLVLVALGAPAQERLIARHLEEFGKGVFIGVGGSFDVLSGSKRRAPAVFVRTNTEWLYRILRAPSRLGRFYRNNVKFLGEVKKAAKAARQG